MPRHPVARVSTSVDVLNQYNLSNDDDAEFLQSIKAIKDSKLIEIIADKQPVSLPEEVPSVLAPKRSKTGSLPQSEACGVDAKPTKLSLSLKKPYCHSQAGNHCSLTKDLLASHDADLVCKWLCQFMETRKTGGSLYPPSSLRSLKCGVNRILQSNQVPFSAVDNVTLDIALR